MKLFILGEFMKKLLAILALIPSLAFAWQPQNVRVLLGFAPGSGNEISFRKASSIVEKNNPGVNFVIENKPGASGILGVSQLISAKPDGYTIGQIPLAITRFAHMGTINFDPLTDITYLGRTAGLTFGLVVNSSSPIKTFEDYVKYAKANPGKLSYGSTGIGTSTHV
jgi:tripartite-type tricarboxylate transporter receptor subunit TctC